MGDELFWWVGYLVVVIAGLLAILFVLGWAYFQLIHGRFGAIIFRKGDRRLSIASWYNGRLMSDDHFTADDYPICERPLYLSYRVGGHRIFFMAGTLGPHRHAVIKGEHPDKQVTAACDRLTNGGDHG
jgi:hypothetical protein